LAASFASWAAEAGRSVPKILELLLWQVFPRPLKLLQPDQTKNWFAADVVAGFSVPSLPESRCKFLRWLSSLSGSRLLDETSTA
jgi:hypothetical protein